MDTKAYDRKTLSTFLVPAGFCILALLVPCALLGVPGLRPGSQTFATWLGRSGSVMSVFALIAQQKISFFEQSIRGTTFAESWALHRKYAIRVALVNSLSLTLAVIGTIIWGYGDLLG
jgi:hypothetical protein